MARTPGSWEQLGSMIFEPGYGVICELSEPHPESGCVEHQRLELGSEGWDEAMVHGRLITALPKLLEACRTLICLDDSALMGEDVGGEWDDAFDAIRIAIAEAEGEEDG